MGNEHSPHFLSRFGGPTRAHKMRSASPLALESVVVITDRGPQDRTVVHTGSARA